MSYTMRRDVDLGFWLCDDLPLLDGSQRTFFA
jgi:hypothetical protein